MIAKSDSRTSNAEKMDVSAVQAILNESPIKESADVENSETENHSLTR